MTAKGVSEVITTTLIIVVTVVLATMFFAWARAKTQTDLDSTADELRQVSDLSCMNASFVVDSCKITTTGDKKVGILFINNSDLLVFNLQLSINGETDTQEKAFIVGRFETTISGGEVKKLSTDTDFSFVNADQATLNDLNVYSITSMVLTNGTCPKKIITLNCDVE